MYCWRESVEFSDPFIRRIEISTNNPFSRRCFCKPLEFDKHIFTDIILFELCFDVLRFIYFQIMIGSKVNFFKGFVGSKKKRNRKILMKTKRTANFSKTSNLLRNVTFYNFFLRKKLYNKAKPYTEIVVTLCVCQYRSDRKLFSWISSNRACSAIIFLFYCQGPFGTFTIVKRTTSKPNQTGEGKMEFEK